MRVQALCIVIAVMLTGMTLALAAPLATGAAALTGTVQAGPECSEGEPHVWVSQGQILLYHSPVPVNGTFEFHVKPGKYTVVANNSKGCSAEQELTLKAGGISKVELKMSAHAKSQLKDKKEGKRK